MVQQQHRTLNAQTERTGLDRELAEEHSRVCWFLSDFFLRCPDQTFLTELQQQLCSQQQQITQQPASGLAKLWQVLDTGVNDVLAQRLAIEHTRLFAGLHRDEGPPPPYESLYRGDNLMGDIISLAVMDSYQQAGYGTIEADAGPQDHIAAELRFMAMLFYAEIEALNQDDLKTAATIQQQQDHFLNEHLLQWVPEYCLRIKKETTEIFYAGVAMMTKEALEKMG